MSYRAVVSVLPLTWREMEIIGGRSPDKVQDTSKFELQMDDDFFNTSISQLLHGTYLYLKSIYHLSEILI